MTTALAQSRSTPESKNVKRTVKFMPLCHRDHMIPGDFAYALKLCNSFILFLLYENYYFYMRASMHAPIKYFFILIRVYKCVGIYLI